MIAFPNIKINLGLSITEKRPDGYHNLETVFYPVALEDALEIRTLPKASLSEASLSEADKKITLHQYGMEIAGTPEDNLVAKAYSLLDKEFHLPPVEIHLYKHIPSGAGLGGGSSDAAFMLKLLNEQFHLNLSTGNIRRHLRSGLCFLYQEQTSLRRRHRQHLLANRTFIKRLSDYDCEAGCFRFHPRSLREHSSPSSRISGQRGNPSSGRRMEGYINQRFRSERLPATSCHRRNKGRTL